MPIQVDNSPDVPALPAAAPAPGQPEVPASQVDTAKPEEPKPKAKRTRGPSKRKAAAKDAPAPADTADAAKPEAADPAAGAEGDELAPLPDEATGFRKRVKKEGHVPVQSSSIPGMSVGDVRKCLNQIRRAGKKIKPEHLLFNGFTAGDFALMFILGNHIKRKGRKEDGSGEGEGEEEAPAADAAAPVAAA